MATRVCVVGSVNSDCVFAVTALPRPGDTVAASPPSTHPGGKGANQAVAAARAAALVEFVGAVGDDNAGSRLRRHLQDNGVGTDGLSTVAGPSGSAVITVDPAGENTVMVVPGANAHLSLDSVQRALISGCDVLLMQLEIPVPVALEAATLARSTGATVMLNVSPPAADPAELAGLIDLTDVAVVNESEAAHVGHQVPHLVVTLGSRGAHYRGDGVTRRVPAPAVAAIDTTGAGDVFAGVLAAGWAGGIDHALPRATVAGSLATLVAGAGNCAPRIAAIDAALAGVTPEL
ncbi:ribokinase [Mycolicibacter minnesotensis]|uniref:Ribokinase n=1 Tax=Mycolicibacter minnesotensis TaxID=1118379 RepID=A0AA91RNM0_9MYCO|nr:ribokinase [Mycolicibacter minnesotensis]ORB04428.1 ribokinase [Mycolicibacter minnesotensis]